MMPASSAMDMSSNAEMSSHAAQSDAGMDHIVNAGAHQSMSVHSMTAEMDMVSSSLLISRKSEVRSSAAFDHSKGFASCNHETCSQVSASPPRASQAQLSYLAYLAYLHCATIPISSPASLSSSSQRIASGTPPPINLAVDLLSTLRI